MSGAERLGDNLPADAAGGSEDGEFHPSVMAIR
jgi:hypothetical protein